MFHVVLRLSVVVICDQSHTFCGSCVIDVKVYTSLIDIG
jgi:hypothetical protein